MVYGQSLQARGRNVVNNTLYNALVIKSAEVRRSSNHIFVSLWRVFTERYTATRSLNVFSDMAVLESTKSCRQ